MSLRGPEPSRATPPEGAGDVYRLLFEHADGMLCTLDLDGRFTSVNPAGERLTGYRADELVGKLAVELIAPEVRDEAVRQFQDRLEAGSDSDYPPDESVLVTRDGRRVPIEVTSTLFWQDGRPVGVLGLVHDLTARKNAESALHQSEERFRSAFAFAAIGMALVGPDGRFLQVNDALCDLVGYSADELLTKTFQDITHPDDLEADLEYVRQMLAGEIRTYQMEKRYFHKLGHVVWIQLSVSLVRGGDGRPLHFISQIQDITEQRRALDAMARSEARLAEAQQIARIGSWEWNVLADEITWSEELFRIFGLDPGTELAYDGYLRSIHPEDRVMVDQVVDRAGETGDSFLIEHRVVLPDGSVRWVQERGEVVMGDGGPITMRGTAQDITEHKEAEEKLREAELRYRTLVEQLPLTTYIRPLNMRAANIYVSPQVEQLLGYPQDEWLTNPDLLAAIIHPGDRERVYAEVDRVRQTGEPFRGEYRYIAPDGRVVWVQDETHVVRDENGQPQCVQGYLLDITERKQAEEERDRLRDELHHAQKLEALGRLAGGVAHDFNNVLTAINGYGELLLQDLEPGSRPWKEAEQIRRAAEQAAALPRQLLAFSRKQALQPRLLDLNRIVLETSDLLRHLVGEAIEVVTIPEAASVGVLADPSQVEQVLLNLAVNARDAMPAGGTLTIGTSTVDLDWGLAVEYEAAPGLYAVVSVGDTGHGMDVETKAKVFEPFFTTKAVGQGSGLGLATVHGIVKQSGGFVRIESEPEKGSTFEIYFPCAEVATWEGTASSEQIDSEAISATVLLVEDEEIVRDLAATALERAGYRILVAANGAEALELCESNGAHIDVLVTDMVMPGMTGRELAERVLVAWPNARVVLMSGYTWETPVIDVGDGRSPAFIQKPFSPHELVQSVHDAVGGAEHELPGNAVIDGRPDGVPRALAEVITCVVADDHPAVLDSVSRFLEREGFRVVARTSRGDEALREIEGRRPSIALLDIAMQPVSGIEVARRAASAAPESGIVLYTGHRERALLEQALDAGARGFVLKEAPLSELMRALTIVAKGGTYVDPELSSALASAPTISSLSPLTKRERQVLALLSEGMTNEKVGNELGISAETVQSHVRNAMAKLDADTRTQAVATAIRQSFIG